MIILKRFHGIFPLCVLLFIKIANENCGLFHFIRVARIHENPNFNKFLEKYHFSLIIRFLKKFLFTIR